MIRGSPVIVPWTIGDLLRNLAAREDHTAVVAFSENEVVTWASKTLAGRALSLARNLREARVGSGVAVALWAPNSPHWIVAALGVLAAGGLLVPIDDLADAGQLEAALNSSGAGMILTTARHRDSSGAILRVRKVTALLLDDDTRTGPLAPTQQASASTQSKDLPVPLADAPAILSWT